MVGRFLNARTSGETSSQRRFAVLGTQAAMVLLWVLAGVVPGVAQQGGAESAAPKPAAQIDLSLLGYNGLSRGARLSGTANISLDFLDARHVLLTFNPKKLFQRLPDCPPTHNDRLMHAVVLEMPSGKVVKETDWYLHDTRRYVWPMGSGRVLLRRLNQLYEVTADLEEKLVLDSPTELLWVSVTPDGKQIIAETNEDAAPKDSGAKNKARVKIAFLDADSMTVQRTMESHGAINLHATTSGFADVRNSGGVWLVRFGPAARDRINITRVKARRSPNILYSSASTLLVGRCSLAGNDYIVSAFTVTGNHLWKQHWSECRYTPVVTASEDGSRFAASTVTIAAATTPAQGGGKDNAEEEDLEQTVQVFDTAGGGSVLSLKAEPAVLVGENLSLSPDGRQLAVIGGTTLNIYALREMSADERTKYLAVKADTPGLYVPLPQAGQKGAAEGPIDISVAGDDAADTEQPSPAPGANSEAPDSVKPTPAGTPATSAGAAGTASPAALSTKTNLPTLTLRTGTQVVAVDVVVTDSRGHLVKGLQQSDFGIAEDGKPQGLRYFREYADAQPAAQTQAPPPAPKEVLPPNIFSNYSQPVETRSVTVILFDLLNTAIADQTHAQAELVKFLKSKPKDSQFALCVLSDRLQMIQGFTQDDNVLLAAARGKKASFRHKSLLDSDSAATSIEAKATAQFRPDLEFFVQSILLQESEARALDADRRMYVTADAFAQLARYLSGIPGRKNLVWLSGSFTLGLSPASNVPNSEQNAFIQVRNYSDNLKRVANLLAEAHVAVYPVDVKGLVTDPLFTAATNDTLSPISMQGSTPVGPAVRGGSPPGGRIANTAIPIAMMQAQADEFGLTQIGEHSTMDKLAAETGGQAFYNTNGIAKAINTATEEGANYYALSYTPANKNYDGAFRKVKVLLAGKKYHLAYRSGYYAVDPHAVAKPAKDLASGLALAAMQQGSPQSRQVVFGARVVPLGKPRIVKDVPSPDVKPLKNKRKGEAAPVEMQLYSIDYAVTPADLRFNAMPDGTYHDVLNFMVTAFHEDGRLAASQISQVAADLKPAVFQDLLLGGVRMHQEIDVPAKSAVMRLGVEDVANSHIGTIEIPLPVKAPPDAPQIARRSMPPVERD
ncbi:MAG: VWA domain-containing protein [Acidobacteriia bacterium]|nr:VWA domain-containing protein [Terriglobia bacterium]